MTTPLVVGDRVIKSINGNNIKGNIVADVYGDDVIVRWNNYSINSHEKRSKLSKVHNAGGW